ncbi:hypothetical protein [Methanosarcina sp. UBA5]
MHNFGDAATAVPLCFAFFLSWKKPNKCFTYATAEDIAEHNDFSFHSH